MNDRMKSLFLAIPLLLFVLFSGCGTNTNTVFTTNYNELLAQKSTADIESSLSGDIRYHRRFKSAILKNQRDLIVYLPPGYKLNRAKHYPVLYMQDGNNVFDRDTAFAGVEWEADETTQLLISKGYIQEIIIVGIYNTPARIAEYTWTPMLLAGKMQGGKGSEYAEFMASELKPFIDRTYRTLTDRDNTAVLGSSLGGLLSIYLGRYHSRTFGKIGMMSPSLWWDNRTALGEVGGLAKDLRIWLDTGTNENPADPGNTALKNARDLRQALETKGYKVGANLFYYEDSGAEHNERYWAGRFFRPLQYFFGTDTKAR